MGKRYNLIRKWSRILNGKSVLHVNQGIGKIYSKEHIKGYYNDLSEKARWQDFDNSGIPLVLRDDGSRLYFPIAISQYGLGVYDIYLMTGNRAYLKKFINIANWLLKKQDHKGGWDTIETLGCKYSAMAQGEGSSVLVRAYQETKEVSLLIGAQKAIDLMITSINDGGTAEYQNNKVYFQEYADHNLWTVLNGWIFSIFGLYDITKISSENKYKDLLYKTLSTLKEDINYYDCSYWSYYDRSKHLSSPFYHNLHIAQLRVLYDLFGIELFLETANKWQGYNLSSIKKYRAIITKIYQKIKEPGEIIVIK